MELVVGDWQNELNRKIDRLLNDVEFIKNRTTAYLGRNEALTYLADETPIFVNTDDFGCPLNFMNGGRYEEDYFNVFLSYRKPDAVFLDIGANLGVYSLRMAPYLRHGKIFSFEPIPRIRGLFSRSVFLNGYGNTIQILPYALSDHDGEAVLAIPGDHAGGASLEISSEQAHGERVNLRRLDDFMPENFVCDMVKLDVEGHELHALHGMRGVMQRSPECIVMFEKLATNSGIEAGVFEYADALGWKIYGIEGIDLVRLELQNFMDKGGYFVAGRPEAVERGGVRKNGFEIHPADLNVLNGDSSGDVLRISAPSSKGDVLFHGPYWYLARGYYRLEIEGAITGSFRMELCERFGYKVADFELHADRKSIEFPVYRDLTKFEFVLRSSDEGAVLEMTKMRVTRIG